MFHWTVLMISAVLVEIPWNLLTATLFFVCWQWTVVRCSEPWCLTFAYVLFCQGLTNNTSETGFVYAILLLFTLYYSVSTLRVEILWSD
jgi:ABC-type multidrug transport system permease subunit